MAALGALHGGHGHGHNGGHADPSHDIGALHGHGAAHGISHAPAVHHSPIHHGDHSAGAHHAPAHHAHGQHGHQQHAHHDSGDVLRTVFLILSPMNIFGICLGTGAVGLLLKNLLSLPILVLTAIVIGLAFNYGVLRLIMKFLMSFSSKSSDGLEGCVGKTVTAVSNFDVKGRGLIKVTVDNEFVQLLAVLPESEAAETPVRKGDELVVLEVNSTKGTCVVTSQPTS